MPRFNPLDWFRRPAKAAPAPAPAPARRRESDLARYTSALRAKYDAAQATDLNRNHWSEVDGLGAASANSPDVRKKLRERARYERDNNSYLSGMAETLSNDVIGTGPRLRVRTDDRDANRRLEDAFEEWTASVRLAEKLRTYREERCVNGEGFLFLATNPRLPTPVQLDLQGVETDQIASPTLFVPTPNRVDGIEFDNHGNPTYYHKLLYHPGDPHGVGAHGKYDRVPADLVLHWFKARRSGQRRGVPEVTPALPLYALLRRFTLGTVTAAEMAALFAVLLKTNMSPATEDGEGDTIKPFETFDLNQGMMAALPEGYDAVQMKPEHPATTYEMFERAIIRQIARCLHIPYAIAAGDSSGLNYSSGRLDHQIYHRMIGVDRYHLETAVLDRVFRAWLAELFLLASTGGADRKLVAGLDPSRLPRHRWDWDGFKHVDPSKEAAAQAQRLANGTTSLEIECAEDGNDWREIADQQAEEREYFAERGIPYPGTPTPAPAPAPAPTPAADGPEDAEDAADPEDAPATASRPRFAPNGNGRARH